jgi:hypothetical protein
VGAGGRGRLDPTGLLSSSERPRDGESTLWSCGSFGEPRHDPGQRPSLRCDPSTRRTETVGLRHLWVAARLRCDGAVPCQLSVVGDVAFGPNRVPRSSLLQAELEGSGCSRPDSIQSQGVRVGMSRRKPLEISSR